MYVIFILNNNKLPLVYMDCLVYVYHLAAAIIAYCADRACTVDVSLIALCSNCARWHIVYSLFKLKTSSPSRQWWWWWWSMHSRLNIKKNNKKIDSKCAHCQKEKHQRNVVWFMLKSKWLIKRKFMRKSSP